MFTFVVCFLWACFACTLSEYLPIEEYNHQNPYEAEYAHEYNNYEPSDYHFQYAVSDPHTGDHKQQWEVKEKGVVRGMYSLLEPDGTTRVVEYIADDHGFRATVKKLGTPIEHHQHHGQDALLSLPEAYSSGYSGAYSGLGENYGVSNLGTTIEANNHGLEEANGGSNYAAPIEINHGLEDANGGSNYAAPIEVNHGLEEVNGGSSYVAPIELSNHEVGENYGGSPIEITNHGFGSNYGVSNYGTPIGLNNHHGTSVEIHGFTGNSDDDSSYTNHEDQGSNNAAIYYRNDHSDSNPHNYYTPQPYKLAYQYEKPYAYIGQSYDGY